MYTHTQTHIGAKGSSRALSIAPESSFDEGYYSLQFIYFAVAFALTLVPVGASERIDSESKSRSAASTPEEEGARVEETDRGHH